MQYLLLTMWMFMTQPLDHDTKTNWIESPSGLKFTIVKHGSGPQAWQGDEVGIYETLYATDGKVLSTYVRPKSPLPVSIGAGQVVDGIDEGVRGMHVGEIRRLLVPPHLSKRSEYPDYISPDDTLVYEIELVEIKRRKVQNVLLVSTDLGKTWEDQSAGLPGPLRVQDMLVTNRQLMIGTDGYGVYEFNASPMGWKSLPDHIKILPNTIVTGLYPSKNGSYVSFLGGGFFQYTPGISFWLPMGNRLRDKNVRAVLESGTTLWVGNDMGLYRSSDRGRSWQPAFEKIQVMSLIEKDGILMAGTNKGILHSKDGGSVWGPVLDKGSIYKMRIIGDQIAAIGASGEAFTSDDMGQSWKMLTPPPLTQNIYDVASLAGYLFCATNEGIFRSKDKGRIWELVHATSGDAVPLELLSADGRLYAGMGTGGC